MKAIKVSLFLISILLVLFTGKPSNAADANTNSVGRSCCSVVEAATGPDISSKSLYQFDGVWTNDFGQPLQFNALAGRPQVVAMFFANCQYACPLLVYKMKQIEAALPENIRTNTGFTLVSFDSERDTPEALHRYRAQHELASNWTLLHGNADNVLEFAALLGVKFKKGADGQFAHSNIITVLNANGEIAFQAVGLNLETAKLAHQIERVAKR